MTRCRLTRGVLSHWGWRPGRAGRPFTSAVVSLGAGTWLLASGCALPGGQSAGSGSPAPALSAPAATGTVDPLVGGPPIPADTTSAPGPKPPSPLGPSGTPPPGFPAPASPSARTAPAASLVTPTSAAALAAGVPRLEGGQDLHIGGGPVGASLVGGPLPANAPTGLVQGSTAAPGAWQGPQGISGNPAFGPAPAPTAPPVQTNGAGFEQLQAQLAARGVSWQRLDMANGEWTFQCAVPNRQDPNRSRNFIARGNPSPVAAITKVLEQIDSDRP